MITLQIGDAILYRPTSLFGHFVRWKTWSPFSHIEIYIGNSLCVASRDGKGVNIYPLRRDGMRCVLRPKGIINILDGFKWFNRVKGQKYDYWGLLRFFTFGTQSIDKQFCSEFATRFYRHSGFEPFRKEYDADFVAPGTYYTSSQFDILKEGDDTADWIEVEN